MAEKVTYLKEMLEVPMIDGQSEDICGQDDRFYAFGLWTDFCGLSDEELKKAAIANAAGSSECCGGGGEDTGSTGSTKTENVISLTISGDGGNYTISADSAKAVDVDVVLTIPYIIVFDDGTTDEGETTVIIKKGSKLGTSDITVSSGKLAKISNDITVEPEESDKYEFTVKNNTDIKFNSVLYGTVLYLDMEDYGLDALSYDILKGFGELNLTGRTGEVSSHRDAEVDPNYRGQASIMEEHAYDFIFLLDADIDVSKLLVTDLNALGEGDIVDLGETIGSIEYDGELYSVYRLSNVFGWSVVVGPGEEQLGYDWKYKLTQN